MANRFLTARRIRVHGLMLAICLWSIYAIDLGTPGLRDRNGLIKGTDFLHFYTLGTLALRGRGDLLYDMRGQTELIGKILPPAAGTVYVPLYGPQLSLFFSPFARLPYGWALALWLLLNTLIYAACCRGILKACPDLKKHATTVFILALAFPGFFHLIAWGQTSGLALACFTLAYLALRAKNPFAAGLAIGCLILKPQLGLAAAVVFLFAKEWKVVFGAILSALAQLALAWQHYGTQVMQNYFHATLHIREVLPWLEPRLYQMHSLRAFWTLLLPWPRIAFALYVLCAITVLAMLVRVWPTRLSLEIRFAALLLATVLISPHLTVYDLVILAPAFLFLADWALSQPRPRCAQNAQILLYACYPLFLLGPVARYTHLQLSVLALAALFSIATRPASLIPAAPATLNTP